MPTNDDPDLVAIAYGPIVLAGEMGDEGISEPAPYAKHQWNYFKYEIPKDLVHTIDTFGEDVSKWVKPVSDAQPLTFELLGQHGSKKITLIPYYRLHHQRYVLYWNLNTKS